MNRKIQATEIDALRRAARKTRLDKYRNETIKQQIIRELFKKKTTFFGIEMFKERDEGEEPNYKMGITRNQKKRIPKRT